MKEINQEIAHKGEGIDLKMEVSMDGETIIDRESDSLIGNFLRMFYGMLGRTGAHETRRMISRRHGNFKDLNATDNYGNEIDQFNWNTDDPSNPPYIDFRDDINFIDNDPFYLYTNIPEMCGVYYQFDNDYQGNFYHIDKFNPRTGEYTKGEPADWSNVNQDAFNGKFWFTQLKFRSAWRRRETFNNPQILLGKNQDNSEINDSLDSLADDQTVSIGDQWLRMEIEDLSQTGTSISQPAVATNDSEITLSRTFTNDNDYPITVGEIGVITDNGVDNGREESLIARDVVSSFTISADSSITIDYTITISNTGGGGMMSQFHQQLYRQLQGTNRNIRDINNNEQEGDRTMANQWIGASTSGGQDLSHNGMPNLGQFIGPVPGITTNELANTNVSLGGDPSNDDGQIPHGTGNDELKYSGAFVDKIYTDQANDEVYFECSRLMESLGENPITVKETAMYVGSANYDRAEYPEYAVMISRHVLDSSEFVTIQPGEIFKLKYTFKISLSQS